MNLSTPESVEQLRRSIAMLAPGAPALNREDAMRVLARLLELMGRDAETPRPDRSQSGGVSLIRCKNY